MPTARTKTKQKVRRTVTNPKAAGSQTGKRTRRKVKTSFSTPYDAKKFAGTVSAFAGVTPEEMRTWRDDR